MKPIDLMRHLVRLVTPPGGTVLDCFAGSGTTGLAASEEGFRCILIEREAEYCEIIVGRLMATPMGLGLDVPVTSTRKARPRETEIRDACDCGTDEYYGNWDHKQTHASDCPARGSGNDL